MTKTDRMTVDLRTGDSLEILKTLDANSIDSVVTDPPYGLSFMGNKWDYDVPTTELWKEVLRVLKPGGHLLSFSSSRTYHRMAVAVEDAGFEIRDQIMWVYGSGFPKSHNIGKAYDKKMGNNRVEVGDNPNLTKADGSTVRHGNSGIYGFNSYDHSIPSSNKITKGTSPYEGWGTALKPAHEPIVLARKPLSEKSIVDNVIKWGTGGINIDKSKISFVNDADKKETTDKNQHVKYDSKISQTDIYMGIANMPKPDYNYEGRFPANFIHDGSDEVIELFPNVKTGSINKGQVNTDSTLGNSFLGQGHGGFATTSQKASDGSAGRFFYCAKVGKKERGEGNNHPTVKPVKLMSYLVNLVTPVSGKVLDPFMGSGSTGMACKQEGFNFIGIDLNQEYVDISKARIDGWKNL